MSELGIAGIRFVLRPSARHRGPRGIRAQFRTFRGTDLPLDHVNAHDLMRMHPTVLPLIIGIGRDYGPCSVRAACEPSLPAWPAEHDDFAGRLTNRLVLGPWMRAMREQPRRAGIVGTDPRFGLTDAGRMGPDLLPRLLPQLSPGNSEIYVYPAIGAWHNPDPHAGARRREEEFTALADAAVRQAPATNGIARTTFGEFAAAPRDGAGPGGP